MNDKSGNKVNGKRVEFAECPKCGSCFDTTYILPAYGRHFIKMRCFDCAIAWSLDDRTMNFEQSICGEKSYVTYVVVEVKGVES